jgi:hypothetical protein
MEGTELSMNNSGFGFKGTLNASGMELQVDQWHLGAAPLPAGRDECGEHDADGHHPREAPARPSSVTMPCARNPRGTWW